MKLKLIIICSLTFSLISCKNDSAVKNNTIQTEQKSHDVSTFKKDSTTAINKSILNNEETNSSILELLQGKWQHHSDNTNFLIFENNHRKEIAGATDKWGDETFTLSNKCLNESDIDNGIPPEKDKYISCIESDLCWYIVEINKENLTLSYMGRGNTLKYKRVNLDDPKNEITEIRKLFKETQDNKSTYKKLTQDDFENASEGGQLTAYKNSTEIRLIEAAYYGHMGKFETEFYYLNNEVYFIHSKDFQYNMPPTESGYDQDKTTLEESRYYFWNNKMIRWITPDGKYVDSELAEFEKESTKQSSWAAELIGMVK